MEQGKTCTKCGEWKPVDQFHKAERGKLGRRSNCKICDNARKRDYKKRNPDYVERQKQGLKEWNQNNKEYMNQYKKEWVEKNKDRHLKRQRQYAEANKDRVKTWNRKAMKTYNAKNREARNQFAREYREKNKDILNKKHREYLLTEKGRKVSQKKNAKRRALKKNVEYVPYDREQILIRDNWCCCHCGIKVHDRSTGDWNTPDKAHVDHIIPISKGGNSEPSNLQTLCRTCNLSKHDKIEQQLSLF